jgi:hypothetical protein
MTEESNHWRVEMSHVISCSILRYTVLPSPKVESPKGDYMALRRSEHTCLLTEIQPNIVSVTTMFLLPALNGMWLTECGVLD